MINFLDLKKINNSFEPELSQAVQRVLDSGWYLQGDVVRAFEREYAEILVKFRSSDELKKALSDLNKRAEIFEKIL